MTLGGEHELKQQINQVEENKDTFYKIGSEIKMVMIILSGGVCNICC